MKRRMLAVVEKYRESIPHSKCHSNLPETAAKPEIRQRRKLCLNEQAASLKRIPYGIVKTRKVSVREHGDRYSRNDAIGRVLFYKVAVHFKSRLMVHDKPRVIDRL